MRPLVPDAARAASTGARASVSTSKKYPEGGGLARAIRTEEAVHLAFGHGQVESVEGAHPPEVLGKPGGLNDAGHGMTLLPIRPLWL